VHRFEPSGHRVDSEAVLVQQASGVVANSRRGAGDERNLGVGHELLPRPGSHRHVSQLAMRLTHRLEPGIMTSCPNVNRSSASGPVISGAIELATLSEAKDGRQAQKPLSFGANRGIPRFQSGPILL
jgi:hypothetical protein